MTRASNINKKLGKTKNPTTILLWKCHIISCIIFILQVKRHSSLKRPFGRGEGWLAWSMPPQRNGAFEVPENKLTRIWFFPHRHISAGSESAFFCKSFLSHLFPNIYTVLTQPAYYCSILIGSFNSHFNFLFKKSSSPKRFCPKKDKKKEDINQLYQCIFLHLFFLLISSFSNHHFFFILKSLQTWFHLVG